MPFFLEVLDRERDAVAQVLADRRLGPVIEFTNPIFTFVAPCAKEGTNNEMAVSKTTKRFIGCAPC